MQAHFVLAPYPVMRYTVYMQSKRSDTMIGAVMMATWAGLTGFVVALAAGYTFPVALAVYSVLGIVTIAAAALTKYGT